MAEKGRVAEDIVAVDTAGKDTDIHAVGSTHILVVAVLGGPNESTVRTVPDIDPEIVQDPAGDMCCMTL